MYYLDANASEPMRPEAKAAMVAAFEIVGNPSSVHRAGRDVRKLVEDAREKIAARFGARGQDVVFVSGGTEADALAIHALGLGRRIAIGATEHDAVRAAAPHAFVVPVSQDGIFDADALRAWLTGGTPALVCIMLANNETGAIQPVAEAAALCREHGAWLHVDAVQAGGRIDVDLAAIGCQSLALSAHKMGGPKGAGALLLSPEHSAIAPLIAGGGQERGRRGGTENCPGISGFGAAANVCSDLLDQARWRDAAADRLKAVGAVVMGEAAPRLPNTLCIATPGFPADVQVMALDLAGVMVSAGAACSSGKVKASPVLEAMDQGELSGCAIRVSGGWNTTQADWNRFVEAWFEAQARHAARHRQPAAVGA